MHIIHSSVKFYQFVLKILSGFNEIMAYRRMDQWNEGQPKSSTFQSGAIIKLLNETLQQKTFSALVSIKVLLINLVVVTHL